MKNDRNNIKVIELMPYGSFPVGICQQSPIERTLPFFIPSLMESNSDQARYWFENEETEVA